MKDIWIISMRHFHVKLVLKLFDLYMVLFHYFDHVNPFSVWNKTPERTFYMSKLEQFAEDEDYIINTMAHYFLGRIYQKIEREPQKGVPHFELLSKRFPENKLFSAYLKDCKQKL